MTEHVAKTWFDLFKPYGFVFLLRTGGIFWLEKNLVIYFSDGGKSRERETGNDKPVFVFQSQPQMQFCKVCILT